MGSVVVPKHRLNPKGNTLRGERNTRWDRRKDFALPIREIFFHKIF